MIRLPPSIDGEKVGDEARGDLSLSVEQSRNLLTSLLGSGFLKMN